MQCGNVARNRTRRQIGKKAVCFSRVSGGGPCGFNSIAILQVERRISIGTGTWNSDCTGQITPAGGCVRMPRRDEEQP
jgi:hypothetical protein